MTLAPFVRRSVFGYPMDSANGIDAMDQLFARGSYPVDVREDADHLYVDAELPGFKKDEIDITLENNELTIAAEHKSETTREDSARQDGNGKASGTSWLLSERRARSFRRSFELPQVVDGANVNAALNDGVLTITLTKRQESKPRKISVG